MSYCAYHPERDAVGACVDCGKLVCTECKTVLAGKIYCNPCVDKRFSSQLEVESARVEAGSVKAEAEPVRAEAEPVRAEAEPVRAEAEPVRAEAGSLTGENTSGQGSAAVVPAAIQGWNWGAFLLTWIWGIGNNVWISLLTFIPLAGFVMAILLGIKGNEWAWQYKRWDNIDHFKRTQRTWTKWGIGVAIAGILLTVLIVTMIIIVGIISESYNWYWS